MWSTVVFGINSARNAVRECEIVRGEAKYSFTLPDSIEDHPITPTSTGVTVAEMLQAKGQGAGLLQRYSIGVSVVAGSGSSTGVESETRVLRSMPSSSSSFAQ